jgi:tRNA (cmo5U34)-methyltransferase
VEILKAGDKVRIKGVDNDPGIIRQAAENLKEYIQSGRLELQEKEAFEFLQNIPDNSVAIVASGFMLHNLHKDHREKIIREIFRILRPGGEFISADKIMPDNEEELRKETGWQMAQFQNIPDQKIREEWIRHYEDDMKPDIILKQSEFVRTLKEAGFREISITSRMHLDALARAVK